MSAPWKGDLRLDGETGWYDIYDESDSDTPLILCRREYGL